jgi:hypothetical protein
MKKLSVAVLAIFLSACGSGLDGTYTDSTGIASYTFKSGGKVAMSTMGIETEMQYKVEDGKVKIGSPQGSLVMTILEDGSIQGPMGMKLTKQKK